MQIQSGKKTISLESDIDFTRAIGLDESYVNIVSKVRIVLSLCTRIPLKELYSDLSSNDLRKLHPYSFDIFDFFDTLIAVFKFTSLPEECFNQYYSINLFDLTILGISIRKGLPTVGQWVRQIILNCIPSEILDRDRLKDE
jgi:hypothetical protein